MPFFQDSETRSWRRHNNSNINRIESVQKDSQDTLILNVIDTIPNINTASVLQYRWYQYEMIFIYKIVNNMIDCSYHLHLINFNIL